MLQRPHCWCALTAHPHGEPAWQRARPLAKGVQGRGCAGRSPRGAGCADTHRAGTGSLACSSKPNTPKPSGDRLTGIFVCPARRVQAVLFPCWPHGDTAVCLWRRTVELTQMGCSPVLGAWQALEGLKPAREERWPVGPGLAQFLRGSRGSGPLGSLSVRACPGGARTGLGLGKVGRG